jgi:hypothetical protein
VIWVASDGTDDCTYYELRCLESGGAYYCDEAPYWCAAFPRGEGSVAAGWSRCTRHCLQECDRAQALAYCPPAADDRPGAFALFGPSLLCHGGCYTRCLVYAASGR